MAVTNGFPVGLLVCSFFCYANASVEISLNGAWRLTNSNKTIHIPATVPGGVYTDLQKQGVIGEPYFGFNDVNYDWVGREDWTFTKTFNVPNSLLNERRVTLVAHGIDTVCSVRLNQALLFNASNMFVRYTADVKNVLKIGTNYIEVSCESPVMYAKRKHDERMRTSYPVHPLCPPYEQHGQCHVSLIRKMQCSFSWDWGPSFPSTGIWKSIELQGYSGVIIRDVVVTTVKQGILTDKSPWILNVTMFYESSYKKQTKGTVNISINAVYLANKTFTAESAEALEPKFTFQLMIPEEAVEPWWPSGYGEQTLYRLNLTVIVEGERIEKITRLGFRFVELNEDPVEGPKGGKEFYFKVNGVPIYAKGSNWVPAHVLPERATAEYVTDLLLYAKEANMNMLRVWGGGIYESDHFYNTVDELGLLIWQDMMFASSQYPSDSDFLKNVEVEVKQQVRRLHHHPSIVVWVGNSESEQTVGLGFETDDEQHREDYRKLYIETIMRVVQQEDPSRPFLPSSPSNGKQPPTFAGFSEDPQSELSGDTHFYEIGGDALDPRIYPVSRFVSELGILAQPMKDTLLPVAPHSSITYPLSKFLHHRQHSLSDVYVISEANRSARECGVQALIELLIKIRLYQLLWGIQDTFQLPGLIYDIGLMTGVESPVYGANSQAYDAVSYLSQVYQAIGIRTAAEKCRRWRSYLQGGFGHNMGFLYWQLNGIWQAPSWASIEYGGHWRMLHYFAKKFFSPVLVSPYVEYPYIKVYVINDKLKAIANASLAIFQQNWATFYPVHIKEINISVPAAASTDVLSIHMSNVSEAKFLWFSLSDPIRGSLLAPETFLVLKPTTIISLHRSSIKVTAVAGPRLSSKGPGKRVFDVHLQTDKIALFVWLSAGNVTGHFSDNGFLLRNPRKIVEFYTIEKLSPIDLKRALTVTSLVDYVKKR